MPALGHVSQRPCWGQSLGLGSWAGQGGALAGGNEAGPGAGLGGWMGGGGWLLLGSLVVSIYSFAGCGVSGIY